MFHPDQYWQPCHAISCHPQSVFCKHPAYLVSTCCLVCCSVPSSKLPDMLSSASISGTAAVCLQNSAVDTTLPPYCSAAGIAQHAVHHDNKHTKRPAKNYFSSFGLEIWDILVEVTVLSVLRGLWVCRKGITVTACCSGNVSNSSTPPYWDCAPLNATIAMAGAC